ncbi:short chain dehydrogenase family protein [Oceaniovalibus guishaninsula JLT2003]|uniref:Short chain dehydrogenase family protein n=1 Tax=Oceaniovalibus guishaninsula JLT2003 TaxID=1231392 RepID=K2H6E5_9RHOB|nr:SDR family oxidoreductase [Oceaniovalibus guishaninsula]EKE43153.1 short chain dehydrogenase family protein [Oceaniovalibus guishaninsula JLT2003]
MKDHTAIVTGGAAGIGHAITTELARRGTRVLAVDIDAEAGKALAAMDPDRIAFMEGDISKEEVARAAVARAVSTFGKLTGLVNNAHASRQKPLLELAPDDWALSFDTGFRGTLNFMKAAHPELLKTEGAIVNFGSGAALNGQPNQAAYAAAKEAIRGLSRVAANEWATDGIRINVVCPLALTEGVAKWKEAHPDQYDEIAAKVPLGRLGDPQKDIAPVVAFLLSDDSRYMTGQTLMADGGGTMLR